jgi:hypothetical protein
MAFTNYNFKWDADCTDFWREWLVFSGWVLEYQDMTGLTYTKVGQFAVALNKRFNAYWIKWKKKGGEHPWHHPLHPFRSLHGKHNTILEQKSVKGVIDVVRSLQNEQVKDI